MHDACAARMCWTTTAFATSPDSHASVLLRKSNTLGRLTPQVLTSHAGWVRAAATAARACREVRSGGSRAGHWQQRRLCRANCGGDRNNLPACGACWRSRASAAAAGLASCCRLGHRCTVCIHRRGSSSLPLEGSMRPIRGFRCRVRGHARGGCACSRGPCRRSGSRACGRSGPWQRHRGGGGRVKVWGLEVRA